MKDEDLVLVRNSGARNFRGRVRLYLGEIESRIHKSASQKDSEEYDAFNIAIFRKCILHEVRRSDMGAVAKTWGDDLVYDWERRYPGGAVEYVHVDDEKQITEDIWQEMLIRI